jgi:hypothetical protein
VALLDMPPTSNEYTYADATCVEYYGKNQKAPPGDEKVKKV